MRGAVNIAVRPSTLRCVVYPELAEGFGTLGFSARSC